MVRPIACWTMALLLGVTALAQESKPTFETASVRPQRERTAAGSQFPIFDETKLRGKFTIEMRSSSMVPGAVAAGGDPSVPPLAAALQEQLGLKLEPRKGPIDVLVIDSLQQPT